MEKKLTISISYLTESLPKEFEEILSCIRSLHFNSEPNYEFLFTKLQAIADDNMFDMDDKDFDWIKIVEERARKSLQERIEKEKELKELLEQK
jgi:hypothetical protein